jgi:anti-sigma factor RsiW
MKDEGEAMTEHDSPVTEDELHAYVDGELPADRSAAVASWLAAHPEQAATVAAWRAQADSIRARYGAVAGEPVPARLTPDQIMRQSRPRRSLAAFAAVAAVAAFVLGGAAGWMARGASAAAPSSAGSLTADAIEAHKLYVVEVRHPVEVPGEQRDHLVQWLSKRVGYTLRAPDLEAIGLKLVGGRLLPGPSGAAAFFMYEGTTGERYTIFCARAEDSPETAMRFRAANRFAAFYWADRDLAYVVSGLGDRDRLLATAQAAYDQIDARPPGRS